MDRLNEFFNLQMKNLMATRRTSTREPPSNRPEAAMEIGNPQRTYTIEPIEDPVPSARPEKPDEEPLERRPEPAKQPATRP